MDGLKDKWRGNPWPYQPCESGIIPSIEIVSTFISGSHFVLHALAVEAELSSTADGSGVVAFQKQFLGNSSSGSLFILWNTESWNFHSIDLW